MARILLAEDQVMVRQGLKMMIETEEEFKVTGETNNGKEAIDLCERMQFDIAILDIRMPIIDGLETAKIIQSRWPQMKILMLTTFDDDHYVMEALRIGVSGYILKNGDTDALLRSIHSVLNGGLTIEENVAAKVVPQLIKQNNNPEADPTLTPENGLY